MRVWSICLEVGFRWIFYHLPLKIDLISNENVFCVELQQSLLCSLNLINVIDDMNLWNFNENYLTKRIVIKNKEEKKKSKFIYILVINQWKVILFIYFYCKWSMDEFFTSFFSFSCNFSFMVTNNKSTFNTLETTCHYQSTAIKYISYTRFNMNKNKIDIQNVQLLLS